MNDETRAGLPAPFMSYPQFPFGGSTDEAATCEVRLFSAPNIGAEFVTAVVTNSARGAEASAEPVACLIAAKIVETFEVEPTRLIYVEYYPARSAELIQDRLLTPATPARFVRAQFDYSRGEGFTNPRREQIEITEVAYLTNTPVEAWHRELEEVAACNRLFAMLGELGAARTFELLECAIQHQRDAAAAAVREGAAPDVSADGWERLRLAVVQLVLCAEAEVLPESGAG